MSIKGKIYGDLSRNCDKADLKEKGITNFDMVDYDLHELLMGDDKTQEFKDAEDFLYHLALCHTIVSTRNPRNESEIQLNASSPDELSLLNAAKYYGVSFVERVGDQIYIDDKNSPVMFDEDSLK
jgi:phospholipid-translocating ATPase